METWGSNRRRTWLSVMPQVPDSFGCLHSFIEFNYNHQVLSRHLRGRSRMSKCSDRTLRKRKEEMWRYEINCIHVQSARLVYEAYRSPRGFVLSSLGFKSAPWGIRLNLPSSNSTVLSAVDSNCVTLIVLESFEWGVVTWLQVAPLHVSYHQRCL